jgi:hypothetical protein
MEIGGHKIFSGYGVTVIGLLLFPLIHFLWVFNSSDGAFSESFQNLFPQKVYNVDISMRLLEVDNNASMRTYFRFKGTIINRVNDNWSIVCKLSTIARRTNTTVVDSRTRRSYDTGAVAIGIMWNGGN